jgi:glutamine synthetase
VTELAARVDELRRDGVRLLAGTIVDNAGVLRTKAVPGAQLQAAVTRGVGLSPVFAVMCVDGFITSAAGYGGPAGDMRLLPDLSAAAMLAPEAGLAWAPMNQHDQELAVMETCQRSALRRWQDQAEAAGHRYLMGLECEFTVFRPAADGPAADGPVPAHAGPAYGLGALLDLEDFVTDAVQELERVGVGVEQFHPEYGPGQMEVSLSPAVPVTAVDQYLLTRIMLRRTARRHGLQVSYAPVTVADPGAVGNGFHVHFSVHAEGRNVFSGGTGRYGMTETGEHLLAGILAGLQDATGLFAPSPLSYARLVPGHWAGAYACWGLENREAALRFVQGTVTSRGSSANCELKSADASANPYLVAAAIIALSQHGVTAHLPLPDPVTAAPDSLPAGVRERAGIRRLPADLGAALDNLQQSRLLRDALGDALIDTFAAVRRYELSTYAGRPLSEVVPLMRWAY